LKEPAVVELLAQLAAEAEAPPRFRAHEWDLVWSIEAQTRKHPHAALDAAAQYLEYEALVSVDKARVQILQSAMGVG